MDLKLLAQEIHDNSKTKGFWDAEPNIAQKLMLIVSELSEAMEADRKDHYAYPKALETYMDGWDESMSDYKRKYQSDFESTVKNSFEDELADAFIRILDLACYKKIDLEWHVKAKMKYNAMRPHMHGKKY